ncbi:tRNA pseudouridine synthase D [Ascodesmis nigricans]|uniref:tRNA pseudouridine synthase D n=1 Tax=Ascodesmis nigricans TaxID=341454 RepID=A0A4S2MPZ3_9PEZI|nr:tRNA pseudouridine synthase D [Ascodesmis nigricans]
MDAPQPAELPPAKRARLSPPTDAIAFSPSAATPQPPPTTGATLPSPPPTIEDQIQRALSAEKAVGITEYVVPETQRWVGVLKMRYSDFLVNEVEVGGRVVKLVDLGAAKNDRLKQRVEVKEVGKKEAAKEEVKGEETKEEGKLDSGLLEKITGLTDEATTAACVALYKGERQDAVTTPVIESKEARTEFHGLIRTAFSGRLLTSTTTNTTTNSINTITITASTASTRLTDRRRRSKRGGKNHRNEWADLGGDYCHFTLYKENKDTMEVISLLSRLLKLKNGNKVFSFAGTKDRRAVTVQRVAAYRVRAERLAGLNRGGESGLRSGVRLGGFEYKPTQLTLGELEGNEFVITLRECHVSSDDDGETGLQRLEETVKKAVERVREHGFANYYGLQRFGTSAFAATSTIGKFLLTGDYRSAVEAILAYDSSLVSPNSSPSSPSSISADDITRAKACALFFTPPHDFVAAANTIPRKYVAENALLRAFSQRGLQWGKLDYLGAIQAIPRGLRMMYVHAYQSLVWNHAVSARLRVSRTEVVEGDLVLDGSSSSSNDTHVEAEKEEEQEQEFDQDGDLIVAPPRSINPADKPADFQRARPITPAELAARNYKITDIVLPTPGWDIVYPRNPDVMKVYEDIMRADGLDPCDMKRRVRDWSLPGSYRKVVGGAGDDKEVEVREEGMGAKRKRDDDEGEGTAGGEKEEGEGEMENVVVVRMRLGTSMYATMALRELMKGGTVPFQPEFGRAGERV